MNAPSNIQPWDEPLREAMHAHAEGKLKLAAQKYADLLQTYPHLSRVAYNLGNIYKEAGNYREAELCFSQALVFEPDLFEAAQNLAFVFHEQGKLIEALQLYQDILKRWPGLPDPRFSLACLQLLTGDVLNGWQGYEARFECLANRVPRRHLDLPLWDGTLTQNLSLLVHTEQGYGDTLQMSRYLALLNAVGIRIILETDTALTPLLSRMPQLDTCIVRGEPIPPVDAQIPLMSLPGIFKTTLSTIPAPSLPPPDPQLVEQMAAQLPGKHVMHIGLCWSGRLDLPVNRKRSCPADQICSLLDAPDCCFVSLQLAPPPEHRLNDPRLLDLTASLNNFHDTAALIACLDLIITIDTSVAHLAGSMGKPTWLLLPFVPDWRWLLERNDSPWYPSMRLFRQPEPMQWEAVLENVLFELACLSTSPAETLTNRGALLGEKGQHVEALRCYQEALRHHTDIAVTYYNRGNSLSALGYSEEARDSWQQALALDPYLVEAWHNLAISYRDQGNISKAHEPLQKALLLRPDDPELHHTLGELYQAEEQFEQAITAFRQSLALRPDSARSWNSLGTVYQSREQDAAAEECYRQALAYDPHHVHARNNLGAVLLSLGKPEASVVELQTLIAESPDYHDGHWNLACSLLAAGDWTQGWLEFEYRFLKHSPVAETHLEIPRWDGSPLASKTILLVGEQAFGDTIQFARFIPQLAAMGARVMLECQATPLLALMAGVEGLNQVICLGEAIPEVDYRLPLMSLPLMLNSTLESVAAAAPYIRPKPNQREQWLKLLSDDNRLRIGLCWWGRQTLRNRRRSCPPELLAPLATTPGITLYRLQIGSEAPLPSFHLVDHTDLIHDFSDTAALISCLDLVITIDTAVAHLAGALGKPVWLMLPATGDWRWMINREDSPWYPSMRIFRQTGTEGWQPVIANMAVALRQLASPSLYLYKPQQDFCEVQHLAQRVVPLLKTPAALDPTIPAILAAAPEQADLLLFPYYLENLTEWATIEGMWQFLENLAMFRQQEAQHIFFSDHDTPVAYHSVAWWFRTSITLLDRDAHTLPLPYQAEDLKDYLHFDLERLHYHASFVGYLGLRKQRAQLLESFSKAPHLSILIEATDAFHGHQPPEMRAARRQRFLKLCADSLCILCPSGDGTNSIRFYEALSLGRLPVLLSDCPLPFEDQIPYHRFVCRISPADAARGGELLLAWLSGLGNEDVITRCREARHTWETWFSPAALPTRLWAALLRARCQALAPAPSLLTQTPEETTTPINTEQIAYALQAVRKSPRSPHAYLQLGRHYLCDEQPDKASSAFLQAISYDHRCFDAYLELARLLAAAGRDHEAVERFYEASLIHPDDPAPYSEALPCLERLGRTEEAAHCRQQLTHLTAAPDSAIETIMAEGDLLRDQERWQEALDCYRNVLEQVPAHADAHLRAGGCLIFLNQHHQAQDYLQHAAALQPGVPDAHINLAICYFADGNWQKGWQEFEWRRQYITESMPPIPELPHLTPETRLDGKSVLVHCEQGFGDMLQFCRYLPLLTCLGATVVFSVPQELARLCQSLGAGITVIPHGELLPATDFQTLLMSLPSLLYDLYPEPFITEHYLLPPQECLAAWKQRTSGLAGIKIGLAWQGRNLGKSGYRRSLDLETLAPLLALEGCSFVNLHPQALQPPHPAIIDFSDHIADFADTAALMLNLDLVITVDTAVAHLAGALGVTCWTALLFAPDWRWFPLNTSSSLWYPSLRLFRQETPGNWQEVVQCLSDSLQEELSTCKGHCLMAEGRETEALACFQKATEHQGASAAAWLNLGNALHCHGATQEGRAALQHAVDIDTTYPEAWQNLGLLHQALGEYRDAYLCFRQALRLRPDYPTARWNFALLQLLLGDYQAGFRNYEARFDKTPPIPRLHQELPLWDGASLHGKRIVVHAEQGYGDTIQFCRYLPILNSMGAEIILEVQDQSLTSLMQSLPCQVSVVTRRDRTPAAELQVPLLSLPRLLGTTLDTVPAEIPYLFADASKIDAWRQRIASTTGLKIGLVWQGSRKHMNDRFRSCPPHLLKPLAAIPGISWYLLQPDIKAESDHPFTMLDLTGYIHNFCDTAALLVNLDLVISVDTAIVHLAGALGRPTWLMLPYAPDWRWGAIDDTTPWYPDTRVFRQETPGDWSGTVQKLVATLVDSATLPTNQ